MLWKHEPQATVATCECFHGSFEFSQTFMSVTITLWKHRTRFCETKAQSNFLCFHRVMVNGFEPIRAHIQCSILFIS